MPSVVLAITSRVLDRIAADFDLADRASVSELLDKIDVVERERVQLGVLHLAHGDKGLVREFVERAMYDYRDILFWAERPGEARIDTPEKKAKLRAVFERLGIVVPAWLRDET